MKKYIISVIIVLLLCGVVIVFSVPDRIKCLLYGISGYDLDDYSVSESSLPKKEVQIDFSTYNKKEIEIYKCDNVTLTLDEITYNGESYRFTYVSHGTSNFKNGEIILYNENVEDRYISNNVGKFVYQYCGNSSLNDDTIEYYFELFAEDEINTDDFVTMGINITVDGMKLVTYVRK